MISRELNAILQARRLYIGVVIGVMIVGLILRIEFIFSDLENIIQVVPDDAFYYLRVAQGIVAGEGSSFDGLTLTNGYHPLWMALVVPLAALFSNPTMLLRMTLLLSAIIELVAAGAVIVWLRRATSLTWLAVLAGSLIYNRITLFVHSMGLEYAITNLMYVLTLWAVYEFLVADHPDEPRQHVRLGVLLGLLFLARTDHIFNVVMFGLIIFFSHDLPLPQRIQQRIRPGLIALAVVLPWLIWNTVQFGSIVQDSGYATSLVLGRTFNPATPMQGIVEIINLLRFDYPQWAGYPNAAVFNALNIVALVLLGWQWRGLAMQQRRLVGLLLLALIPALALYLLHSVVRGVVRPWYFGTHTILHLLLYVVVLMVSLSSFIERNLRPADDPAQPAAESMPPMYRVFHGLLALTVIAPLFGVLHPTARAIVTGKNAPYPHQTEMLAAAYWLRDHTPEDAVGSAFNAGIISYFSERRVVNLDGLVNHAAYRALEDRALFAYIAESPIQYYLDYHPLMLGWYQPYLGEDENPLTLEFVDEIPPTRGGYKGGTLQIFEVHRGAD